MSTSDPGTPPTPGWQTRAAVLGPPDVSADSLSRVLTLGVCGSVRVKLVDSLASDGPGADILVWADTANDEMEQVGWDVP